MPELLDEVHRLIERRRLRFVFGVERAQEAGRRQPAGGPRRGGADVSAGLRELEFESPVDLLVNGSMPLAVTGADPAGYLLAYAETYLEEEIRAEALTRSIGSFSRFRKSPPAERAGDQPVGADAAVGPRCRTISRSSRTPSSLGPPLKRATKQVAHPKFYLFDCGVARALSGRLPYPPTPEEEGALLETLLYGEMPPTSPMRSCAIRSTTGAATTASRWTSCARRGADSWRWRSSRRPGGSAATIAAWSECAPSSAPTACAATACTAAPGPPGGTTSRSCQSWMGRRHHRLNRTHGQVVRC